MSITNEIVVIDWIKKYPYKGNFLNLTLSSDQRKILRGKRKSDCNKEIHLQLPREGKLNDGDILLTNHKNLFVQIIAQKENLIEITAKTNLELIKVAYHLGNRHMKIEINTLNIIKILLLYHTLYVYIYLHLIDKLCY